MITFMDLYRIGARVDIDDYISAWHKDTSIDMGLPKYLGMTEEEYKIWVETGALPGKQKRDKIR